jgi:hypothetical protein
LVLFSFLFSSCFVSVSFFCFDFVIVFSVFSDPFRFISALVQVGQCPAEGALLDFTPIDFVSETIASLALYHCPLDEISHCYKFHISNPHPRMEYQEFASILNEMGFGMRQEPLEEVTSIIAATPNELRAASLSLDLKEVIGGVKRTKIVCLETTKVLGMLEFIVSFVISIIFS